MATKGHEMKWKSVINPRVLIVEDHPNQVKSLEHWLAEMPEEKRRSLGIDQFEVDYAGTMAEAEHRFAKLNQPPYDLMFLDLGIPKKRVGESTPPENGQRLLERAQQRKASKGVIVTSVWKDIEHVAPAFRSGAVDFVPKPYTARMIESQVIGSWKRILFQESVSLLGEQRISDLVWYAEKSLAHSFAGCISSLIQAIAHNAEDLERFALERYGLDRNKDKRDPFFDHLRSQEESVAKATKQWTDLQARLVLKDESSQTVPVETILHQIHQSLLACLIIKNATLDIHCDQGTNILTFGNSVRAVLRELIAGALVTLPDYNQKNTAINITVERVIGRVKVSFHDGLSPIPAKYAKEINDGKSSPKLPLWFQQGPRQRSDRVWGLSVMQQLALRGAGRLEIQPKARGNLINYFIPAG